MKQFKIGLVTNSEGYPVSEDILDGNLDDKSWNRALFTALAEDFTIDKLKTLTYIADSAFVTNTNLELAETLSMNFISRLPATYELAEKLTLKAFADDD